MVHTQGIRDRLFQQLLPHGWARGKIRRDEHFDWDWLGMRTLSHISEDWSLESLWYPGGLRGHVILFIFPRLGRVGRLEVRGLDSYGMSRFSQEFSLSQRNWKNQIEAVFRSLEHWRDQYQEFRSTGFQPEIELTPNAIDEPAWRDSGDPEHLFRWIQGQTQVSERKLRLVASACCRRLPYLMEDVRNQQAVEAMERYADRLIPKKEMKKARKAGRIPWLTSYDPGEEARQAIQALHTFTTRERYRGLCEVIRDIVGNPFRPVLIKHVWRTCNEQAVLRLARTIYEERRFQEMPILGDALEDAGCEEGMILEHCRSPLDHMPGCWVLDQVLQQE
jgi:hypothetical protein